MKKSSYIRITLRIPEALHAKLAKNAEKNSKSLNTEIITRLSQTFSYGKTPPSVATGDFSLGQAEQEILLKKIEELNQEVKEIQKQLRQQARSF